MNVVERGCYYVATSGTYLCNLFGRFGYVRSMGNNNIVIGATMDGALVRVSVRILIIPSIAKVMATEVSIGCSTNRALCLILTVGNATTMSFYLRFNLTVIS